MTMQLTSTVFANGNDIPARFTCDGKDLSPPLAWSGAPPGTRSFAIICSDPDAPSGIWYHWAAFDIPHNVEALDEHFRPGSTKIREAVNDFGRKGYGGPCPPRGHGRHHYHFTLYALDVQHLDISTSARCDDVEEAVTGHTIATAKLTGLYAR